MCKNVSVVRIYVDSFIPSTAGMITGHVTCPPGERNNEMGSAVFVKFCVILPFPYERNLEGLGRYLDVVRQDGT